MADQSDPVYIIPDSLNLGLLFISAAASAALLYGASHAPNLLITTLCAIAVTGWLACYAAFGLSTFTHSINLMLIARHSLLRASDVPELIDLLTWCSPVRDLQEDMEAGLVNIPREILAAAQLNGATPWPVLVANPLVRDWIKNEHQQAKQLLLAMEQKLPSLRPFPRFLHCVFSSNPSKGFRMGNF